MLRTRWLASLTLSVCVLIPAAAFAEARNFKVTTDKTVDASSLESIVRDVIAHAGAKTNDEKAGWKCRYLGWPGHTTIEVFYDGRWHYLDVFLKCYYWSKDKSHIASQEEIANDPSIVLNAPQEGRAARQNLCCGDLPADVV